MYVCKFVPITQMFGGTPPVLGGHSPSTTCDQRLKKPPEYYTNQAEFSSSEFLAPYALRRLANIYFGLSIIRTVSQILGTAQSAESEDSPLHCAESPTCRKARG